MSPVLVYVLQDFNITLTTWGIVAAIGAVFGSIGAYVFSNLADQFGRKSLIIWPTFAYIPIAIGTALAPNFMTVAILYILGSIVVAGMLPAVQAAARDITPRMGRAMSYSWISLAFVLGALTSNWAGAIIIPIWPGWRPQFWVAAGVALFTVLIVGFLYKDLSERIRGNIMEEQTDKVKETVQNYGFKNMAEARKSGNLVYKDWRLWVVSVVVLFWAITYITIVAYVPLYFTQYFGIEPAKAASLSNVFWIVAVFSIFIGGWVSDKLQVRKTVTIFGGITTGIMLIILATLPPNASTTSLITVWCLIGFFAGFIYPAWCALISENAEAISPFGVARAFGIAGILNVFSGVLLNFGLPFVVKSWGWPTWMFISGICCLLIATCAGFGRGPWWIPKKQISSTTTIAK